MHGQMICASLCKRFEMLFRFFDHQMHIERKFGDSLAGFDDERSHADVGDEVTIHHINMQPVRAGGFARRDLFTEARKICSENGWGEDVAVHFALGGVLAAGTAARAND